MKAKITYFFQFLFYTLLFFVLARANIGGEVFPFAFPLLFALAWVNQKVWILAPAYIVGFLATYHTFEDILSCAITILLFIVPYYIHVLLKKPMKEWELFIYSLLGQVAKIVFDVLSNSSIVATILSPLFGVCLLYLYIKVFTSFALYGFSNKLTIFQKCSVGVLLLGVSAGLYTLEIPYFSFIKFFVAFFILTLSYTLSPVYPLSFASIMGIGSILPSNNPVFVSPFILWAIVVVIFKMNCKFISPLALIGCEFLIGYYFKLYYSFEIINIIPVALASVLFVLLNKNFLSKMTNIFSSNADRLAIKNIVNRNRDILYRRINNLSQVFFDMNEVFKKLLKSKMSSQQVEEMLYEEIKNTICQNCPEHNHCHRTFCEDTKKIFKNLIAKSLQKGKITILDFPSYLSSRCKKANYMIGEINTLTSQYKSYSTLVGNVDTSKLLISDQLQGVSVLMKNLASDVDSLISFDKAREQKLIDELMANNIVCVDCVVYEKDANSLMVCVVVRESDVNKLKLCQIVSKICNHKMVINQVYPSPKAGLVNVDLKTAPKYDCIFGLALEPKTGMNISGDCHSVERLDGDKFLFAICDGMGNGKKAGEKSETTVSLVENFYKAGFDNELILSSVNKLLNLEKDDIFSTIDLCTIDLGNGIADFIKMGANSSYIRKEDECQIIEGGALPVGIVEDAKALIKKVVLSAKDFIVICSDGINDTFKSDNEFKDFLLSIKTANPQEFADEILSKALANNNGYACDDMTCLVVKIF